jgi:formate hydrogenlyase subunit 6/NADH:ubiquinone oxidoreductase subunit I
MKLGAMIGDITASLFKRPNTEKYPFERREPPERLRGHLIWDPEQCTGCSICAQDCPAGAIDMIVLDKAEKRFVLRYHVDRCTFCAQCVSSCRQGCISLSSDHWELAALSVGPFVVYYGDGADVDSVVVAESTSPDAGAPEEG